MTQITLADGGVLDVGRFPLPAGLEDGVLNRAQLALAFRVSENTITKWAGQGMPVQAEGANGVAYEYRLSHCYAWRMARDAHAREARARGDALAQQAYLALLNLDDDEAGSRGQMTADEVRKAAEAEYQRLRVDEQRGDLVRRVRVQELLDDLLISVRTTIATMPDYCEREFGLTPAQVARLEDRCDQLLGEMAHRIAQDIVQRPADVVALPGARAQTEMAL